MEKTKTVRMPAGIRNKLLAAIAMLLVSSIMMVSSTYAWFTLSTAPEVTGITTSVGANGNLEIALLTTDTYGDMTTIQSNVGSSSAVQAVNKANITWGNLVDLSASGYGLSGVALMPAALAYNADGITVNAASPLRIAEYGADGRVTTVNGTTVSAVATNGAFAVGEAQTYGVRAIGTTSSMSAREIAFRNSKSIVNSAMNTAKKASQTAIYGNLSVLIGYATSEGGTPTSYKRTDVEAFLEIADGVVADLAALENGYKNALIASAAATAEDDEAFALLKEAIEESTLEQLIADFADYGDNASTLTDAMEDLDAAQKDAKAAQQALSDVLKVEKGATAAEKFEDTTTVGSINDAIKLLVSGIEQENLTVYISGGAVGELGAQVGTFELASVASLGAVYAGANPNATDAEGNPVELPAPSYSVAVALVTTGLTAPSSGSENANITDTYGYIIDFAFRTNAADSFLQLQTAAVNRVYSDAEGTDLATQGSGSTVTYTFASGMSNTQVETLLGAVKLVFLNTADGTVYATANLTDIVVGTTEATANVKLVGQTGTTGQIVALNQNEATAISVLVYLEGEEVDNSAVANGTSSGVLNLNLQFSSSAELIPMDNTALKNMTADQVVVQPEDTEESEEVPADTYTVTFDANYPDGVTVEGTTEMAPVTDATGTYTLPVAGSEGFFTAPDGYTFGGWALTETVADETAYVTSVAGEDTVYAIWVTT